MGDDLFNFDGNLEKAFDEQINPYEQDLKRAKIYCVRGQFDKAEEIYNEILDKDMENKEAYIGLLRAHSEDFTVYNNKLIERDIHTIDALFPDLDDPEYLKYIRARNDSGVLPNEKVPANLRGMDNVDDILAQGDALYEKESYSDAYQYYARAAEFDSPAAYLRMGTLFQYGSGVNKDINKAVECFKKSIDLGCLDACYALGNLYANDGQNDQMAVRYYGIGAENGERSCMAALGYMYMNGRGVKQDYGMAFKYLSEGLEAQPEYAASSLGYLYENGYGTQKDLQKAYELYQRAAEFGDEWAQKRVKYLNTMNIIGSIFRR